MVLEITHNGETHTVNEWSEILGVYPNTIRMRYLKGKPIDKGNKTKPSETLTCPICSKVFVRRKWGQEYCSADCASKGQIKSRPTAICQTCGKTFTVGRDTKGLYCSHDCQHKSMKVAVNAPMRKKLSNDYKKQCNNMVRWMMHVARSIEYTDNHTKVCVVCGKTYIARNIKSMFCGDKCYKHYDNARRDKRIYRNGKPDLSISLTKLYMRDGGVCQLCGREIDFDCDSNSDDYPSIDHVIPLVKGGKHEWSNVQLACRGCNQKKGTRFMVETLTPPPRTLRFQPWEVL